jgi:arsenate reductase (glutaredoxin)
MHATIWHNPNCGTSRKTLAILRETSGVTVAIIEYLRAQPVRETLEALYRDAGMTPREGLRVRALSEEDKSLTDGNDDAILDAMVTNPSYIERPLVRTDKGVRLCRPPDSVREIL